MIWKTDYWRTCTCRVPGKWSPASCYFQCHDVHPLLCMQSGVWSSKHHPRLMNEYNNRNSSRINEYINEYKLSIISHIYPYVCLGKPITVNNTIFCVLSHFNAYELISLGGWVSTMCIATSITRPNQQLNTNALTKSLSDMQNSWGIILTLFERWASMCSKLTILWLVVIIIRNYSTKTGTALPMWPQWLSKWLKTWSKVEVKGMVLWLCDTQAWVAVMGDEIATHCPLYCTHVHVLACL